MKNRSLSRIYHKIANFKSREEINEEYSEREGVRIVKKVKKAAAEGEGDGNNEG